MSANIVTPILTKLFNTSIRQATFPKAFKIAEVVSMSKQGSKKCCTNYRPISILSPFSKILKNVSMTNFINILKNDLLSIHQFGFRQGLSTQLAVTQLYDDLVKAKDKKLITCYIFLDLKKPLMLWITKFYLANCAVKEYED